MMAPVEKANHIDLGFVSDIRTQLRTVLGQDYPEDVEQFLQNLVLCCCRWIDKSLIDSENDGSVEDKVFYSQPRSQRTSDVIDQLKTLLVSVSDRIPNILEDMDRRKEESLVHQARLRETKFAYIQRWRQLCISASGGSALPVNQPPYFQPPTDPTRCYLFTLPVELLAEVLSIAAQEDPSSPLITSHVNSHLRTVALGTSALWTTIDFNYPTERVQAHLERSASRLLEIKMLPSPLFEGPAIKYRNFVGLIRLHQQRIRSIHATVHWANLAPGVVGSFFNHGPLHNLEQVDLELSAYDRSGIRHPYCPRILWRAEDLWLTRLTIKEIGAQSEFPTIQLSLIGIMNMPWETLCSILTKTKSLEYLELSECDIEDPIDEYLYPIELNELREIVITRCDPAITSNVLDSMTAPNLVSLHILSLQDIHSGSDEWLPETIAQFPTLQSLYLWGCEMSEESWTTLFEGVAGLPDLHLGGCTLIDCELDALGGGGSIESVSCPKLRTLQLDNELFLNSDTIRNIVSARLLLAHAGVKKIQSVHLRGWDEMNIDPEDIRAIRGVVQDFTLDVIGVAGIFVGSDDDDEEYAELDSEDSSSDSSGEWADGDAWVVNKGWITESQLRPRA